MVLKCGFYWLALFFCLKVTFLMFLFGYCYKSIYICLYNFKQFIMFRLFKRPKKKAEELQNFYIDAENFTEKELICASYWNFWCKQNQMEKGFIVNNSNFDFKHYFRVKQSRGLINSL